VADAALRSVSRPDSDSLAAAGSPAAIRVKVAEIRTAEAVIVKVRVVVEPFAAKTAVRGMPHTEVARIDMVRTQVEGVDSISSAKMRSFEATDVAVQSAHVPAQASHVTAHTADVAAAHVTASAATRLCIGRKQAAGQHGARQEDQRSSHHHIILSKKCILRSFASAVVS